MKSLFYEVIESGGNEIGWVCLLAKGRYSVLFLDICINLSEITRDYFLISDKGHFSDIERHYPSWEVQERVEDFQNVEEEHSRKGGYPAQLPEVYF